MGECLILVKLPETCNFTKTNTPPWLFFTFLKLYKWFQIAQRITYLSTVSRITFSLAVNFQSDVLCNLVLFVKYKKCKKHPQRSITFSKASLQHY